MYTYQNNFVSQAFHSWLNISTLPSVFWLPMVLWYVFDHLVQKNDGTTGRAGDKIYTISLPDHHIPVGIKNDWIIMSWIRNNSEITDLPPLYIFLSPIGSYLRSWWKGITNTREDGRWNRNFRSRVGCGKDYPGRCLNTWTRFQKGWFVILCFFNSFPKKGFNWWDMPIRQ